MSTETATRIDRVVWRADTPETQVFLDVADIIARARGAQTISTADARTIRSELASTLLASIRARSERSPDFNPTGRVLERLENDWVVTDSGLENLKTDQHYTIDQLRRGLNQLPSAQGGGLQHPTAEIASAAKETWTPYDGFDPYTLTR